MVIVGVPRRFMVKPCLLLLAGGLAAQHSTTLPASDSICLLLVASVCALVVRRARLVALPALGYALFVLAGGAIIDARLDARYAGDSMLTTVRISGFVQRTATSAVFDIVPLDDARIPGRSRISWFNPAVVPAVGEVWQLELRLKQPRGNLNPGVFDFETWLFRERYHATGYVVPGKRNQLLWAGDADWRQKIQRHFTQQAMAAAGDRDAAAVLAAVGVGARHLVSREQWDGFAASGTSHLMAISGLHVGLAAMCALGVVWGLFLLIPVRRNHVAIAIIVAAALAAAYALLSGFAVPARRATLMLGSAALTVAMRREVAAPRVLAISAIVVYLTDPVASLTPGFHLSFAAVVLLVWLARRAPVQPARLRAAPLRLAILQVFLMFGLTPLTALLFQRVSLVATPVNLVAVPVFSFVVVPLVLAALVAGAMHEQTGLLLMWAASKPVEYVNALIAAATSPTWSSASLPEFTAIAMSLLVLPLAWVVLPRSWPGRSVACIGFAAVLGWQPPGPPADCFDTWVLDAGQGLAVVVQTPSEVVLYDTGMAWRGGGSTAASIILPFLAARGVQRVDRLTISHADIDHRGGVDAIREALPVGPMLIGERIDGVPGWLCRAGQSWWSGAVRFEVLYPGNESGAEGNDSSCVLRISVGAHALLLTGDIEKAAERDLVKNGAALGADVIVVPHHGSATSSSMPFVDSVSPLIAVNSAGYANRWGLPRPEVVRRWQASGAEFLNTARDGAIYTRICAQDGVIELTPERERRRRFWHAAN